MNIAKLVSLTAVIGLSLTTAFIAQAESVSDEKIATLRLAPLDVEPTPPVMQKVLNTDIKQVRNYPMQPPVIPHKIDGYQVDLKVNKCMSCHARKRTGESQAPMVSVTHYMDRENNFLADLSPRRYFCTQCHVPQLDAKELVGNDFVDIDHLIKVKAKQH
ncbi:MULTISPECIES: nitrate reductase cytochrome c-type subunit [Shewanella]|uniref:nitrate reductase cytochrome c-type subunit n=1 Tax=Shewanella TaxID=22 RepID=UPI00048EEAB5|nr:MULTISPECIES: nitrate reductase cytochrome c-type subunit [Shewanella]QLE85754.1 nitrate reductase cytochrome c-type subunit [Shewanella sp. Scap07]